MVNAELCTFKTDFKKDSAFVVSVPVDFPFRTQVKYAVSECDHLCPKDNAHFSQLGIRNQRSKVIHRTLEVVAVQS